jgi:hypothetical protein
MNPYNTAPAAAATHQHQHQEPPQHQESPQHQQALQLPVSTGATPSPFAATAEPLALRNDSGTDLRRRATRQRSHDIEAQRRSSSLVPPSPAVSLSGVPEAPEAAAAAAADEMPLHTPLEHHWNLIAIILMLFNFAATGFYFYIRVTGLMWASEGLW